MTVLVVSTNPVTWLCQTCGWSQHEEIHEPIEEGHCPLGHADLEFMGWTWTSIMVPHVATPSWQHSVANWGDP